MLITPEQTLEAYERWAPSYEPVPHNPLMRAEQCAMLKQWPHVSGGRALDLACGSGRYAKLLTWAGAATVIALDFSAGMLQRVSGGLKVRASMMSLPFVDQAFDVIVSGLAIGHASSIDRLMSECARVLDRRGILLYSDFHAQAAHAGLVRSFKDATGATCVIPHHAYDLDAQVEAATAAGMVIESTMELRAGIEIAEPFTGSEEFYRQWQGLPLALIVRARKR